jgi:hypothetical protein
MTSQRFKVEYDSNNSGGKWWLSDDDWRSLEKAGWEVEWFKDDPGRIFSADANGRWLGALASSASVEVEASSEREAESIATEMWSRALPDQEVYASGCECCGRPHDFYAQAVRP